MDTTASSFTARNNAKRAAEKMIANGKAPAVDYGIRPRDDGRFEIVWKTVPTTGEVETEIATTATAAEDVTTALTRSSWSTRIRAMRHPVPGLRRTASRASRAATPASPRTRQLARQTPIAEIQEELFDLADRLERMDETDPAISSKRQGSDGSGEI
jgi:hypothetical protein